LDGVPDFEGQGQGQVKVKGQTLITICSHFRIHFQHKNTWYHCIHCRWWI